MFNTFSHREIDQLFGTEHKKKVNLARAISRVSKLIPDIGRKFYQEKEKPKNKKSTYGGFFLTCYPLCVISFLLLALFYSTTIKGLSPIFRINLAVKV